MDVIEEGIRRTTFPLPFGLDHVHCDFLRTESIFNVASEVEALGFGNSYGGR